MTSILKTDNKRRDKEKSRSHEGRSRDQHDIATSQGTPGVTRMWKGHNSLEPFEVARPCQYLDFRFLASRTMKRNSCHCKPPSLWSFVIAALGNWHGPNHKEKWNGYTTSSQAPLQIFSLLGTLHLHSPKEISCSLILWFLCRVQSQPSPPLRDFTEKPQGREHFRAAGHPPSHLLWTRSLTGDAEEGKQDMSFCLLNKSGGNTTVPSIWCKT